MTGRRERWLARLAPRITDETAGFARIQATINDQSRQGHVGRPDYLLEPPIV
ncbi:hypothetical protein HZF05_06400 [Sphingomonas sp. CGMCC 1.13654]|uniref:Uncharacterized protein n=1 Tax=Sphingomonas chungangi TaxID=2683589 RepID=A0A838L3V2_9SPHN|nr:hypothetical protein [Sphingomonas chungangi]MBA2933727.1 hypothetical protein [Sphingomonas chungangi]MVW55059.1 hypothetical protein [Sphingomonas chungangi]